MAPPTSVARTQPWKAVWPAEKKVGPETQVFGFKKGEVMVFDGNAGNFFPHGDWALEQESSGTESKIMGHEVDGMS